MIRIYKRGISPMLGPACRYYPTCSDYAVAAIRSDGAWRGSWRTLKRLARCHPFGGGGLDLP